MREPRLDVAECKRLPVTMVFLPACDIATYVAEGNVDLGITGEDIIAESNVDVKVLCRLGIGKCRLCVQAPIGTVKDVRELAGKRIVTSFPHLAQKFFDDMGSREETKIKYVSGSVEVACNLGLADGILDLVETGTTMRAAGLEVVAEVLRTETVLLANPHSRHAALVEKIHKRIQGYLVARESNMITYNVERSKLAQAILITPGKDSATVSPLEKSDWVAVTALVRADEISDIMDRLCEIGARSLVVFDTTNCRI